MLIYCRSVVAKRSLALRSLQPHATRPATSLLHTSSSLASPPPPTDPDKKNNNNNNNKDVSNQSRKSDSASSQQQQRANTVDKRKQLLKKFAKIEFIPLEKTITGPKSTPKIELKPDVNYEKIVRKEATSTHAETSSKPSIKPSESQPQARLENRAGQETVGKSSETKSGSDFKSELDGKDQPEKTSSSVLGYENSAAFKIAQLIDKKEPEKAMKNLLDPLMRKLGQASELNRKEKEEVSSSSSSSSSEDESTSGSSVKKSKKLRIKNEIKKYKTLKSEIYLI